MSPDNLVKKTIIRCGGGIKFDWGQRKLINLTGATFGGGTPSKSNKKFWNGDFPWIQSSDLNENKISEVHPKNFITQDAISSSATKIIPKNSIAIVSRVGVGKVALIPFNYSTSQDFLSLSNLKINTWFAAYSIHRVMKKAASQIQGTSIKGITKKDVLNTKLSFPASVKEQIKLSTLLKRLDSLLSLQQRKLEQLKQLKKAMLQQLFAEKNNPRPIMRFNGFDSDWEQRKLGRLGTVKSGVGFPVSEQGGTRGIPFFKVSDMSNIGNELIMKNANNYVSSHQIIDHNWHPIIQTPAIIFAKVGAALMLNRKRLVNRDFLIDNNTMSFSLNNDWDSYFAISLFQTLNLPKYAQTGALPSFNASDIKNISVQLPKKDEQKNIGLLLKKVFRLIDLQQLNLDHLNSCKKFLGGL